jgi:non-homologous end joining protein Ku
MTCYTVELFCESVRKSHYPDQIKAQILELAAQIVKLRARGWQRKADRLSDEIAELIETQRIQRLCAKPRPATEARSVC